ncbi:MAG: hypothetical protein K0R92_2074 [Lachnospiraceae bacterium]|jgi:hypothetical protein|nr:hypothetical protein [Lachnospiraceae bacterium]
MKGFMGIMICLSLLITSVTPTFAMSMEKKQYGSINAEYSDNRGNLEQLTIMIQDGHVYANAQELGERLGFSVADTNEKCVSIYNNQENELPYGLTQFFYDNTKVNHVVFNNMVEGYEAPFTSIKDDKGMWIPMEYSLLLLNSSMLIADDTVVIDIPEKNIIDTYMDIMRNNDTYLFNWGDDFGYSDGDLQVIGGASHIVNLFNGVLGFDGDSWKQLFQTMAMDSSAYDSKYGQDIAMLLCTTSDGEYKAEIDRMNALQDVLFEDGKVGKLLSKIQTAQEMDMEAFYKTCENTLKNVEKGNSEQAIYNRAYRQLERALDKQSWFSDTGENILAVQKGVSGAVTGLDMGMRIAEVIGYMSEFADQDKFSVQALDQYLSDSGTQSITSESMKKSMLDYSQILQTNVGAYSLVRFMEENLDELITSGFSIGEALGTQANIELFVWSLASDYITFLSEGISAADKFELALYATIFQADAFQNYQNYRNQVFEDKKTLTLNDLYTLSQYCYIYLKSCYITRDAAIGSLKGKTQGTEDKIQPVIDYQKSINDEIAMHMVKIKSANLENDLYVYGFLPENNATYLEKYDDSKLESLVKSNGKDLMEYFGAKTSEVLEDFDDVSDNGSTDGGWEYGNDTICFGASDDHINFIMISNKCNNLLNGLQWGMEKDVAIQKLLSEGWSLGEETGKYFSFVKNGDYGISLYTEDNIIKQIVVKASNGGGVGNSIDDGEAENDTGIQGTTDVNVNVTNNLSKEPYITTVEISLGDSKKWNIVYDENTDGYSNGWNGDAVLVDLNKDGRDEVIVKLSYVGSTYGAINVFVYSVDENGPKEILHINDYNISEYDSTLCTCDGMTVDGLTLKIKGSIYGSNEEGILNLSWNGEKWSY